jgi:hypothetical protein
MSTCVDPTISTQIECNGTFVLSGESCAYLPTEEEELACKRNVSGVPFPRLWTTFGNQNLYAGESFADTPHSMLVVRLENCDALNIPVECVASSFYVQVFELLIGENWPSIMINAVDGGFGNGESKPNANPAAALYFILAGVMQRGSTASSSTYSACSVYELLPNFRR